MKIPKVSPTRWFRRGLASVLMTVAATGMVACSSPSTSAAADLELIFTYGSEKETWVTSATDAYNKAEHKMPDGRRIKVLAYPMGSGEAMAELLDEKFTKAPRDPKKFKGFKDGKLAVPSTELIELKAHLTSPASGVFVDLYNARSQKRAIKNPGDGEELLGQTRNLVRSPIVIAMFKPMAEALGWSEDPEKSKPIGWADILKLAHEPTGWASVGTPEWGSFKFAHTNAKASTSGLLAVLAEVYAGSGKDRGLTTADVERPETLAFVRDIERSVVHYASSTGFFAEKMFANGPSYLGAAVLYENLVIESYDRAKHPASPAYNKAKFPVVAIYPKDGTFYSDHPIGIVQRRWVDAEHAAAAEDYIGFLRDRPQQVAAMASGFRPGDDSGALAEPIQLASPIDRAHGVNPDEKIQLRRVPSGEVLESILVAWEGMKKHAQVVLVIDRSGSMLDNNKITAAQDAASAVISGLGDENYFSLLTFNDTVPSQLREIRVGEGRAQALAEVDKIFASGGTALYDAVKAAHLHLKDHRRDGFIPTIIVLSDGADTKSKTNLANLLGEIRVDNERAITRVFTIHYLAGDMKTVMEQIAKTTQAKAYEGRPENIEQVLKDIFLYF